MVGQLDHIALESYLIRVGHAPVEGGSPSLSLLTSLHRAHATAVPFENLDILLGRSIRIDLASVFDKIVVARRGGYCFEQNTLLAAVLGLLGFDVTPLAARVLMGGPPDAARPRTHMCLAVDIDSRRHLCDVGFGAAGPLEPVALVDGQEVAIGSFVYRVVSAGRGWALELYQSGAWMRLYSFTEDPEHPADFEVANHFTSTHPSSNFTRLVTAQRGGDDLQLVLRGNELSEHRPEGVSVTAIGGDEELLAVLQDRFDLQFPGGTVFRPLDDR